MYNKTLSIIIVNYNVKDMLEQCLYSVKAAITDMDVEVFVVDNASSDGSIAYVRTIFPEFTYIESETNDGFSRANNKALALAEGEYILFLNPDTVLGESTLRSLILFMDEHPKAGAIGLKMIDGHGCFLPESKRSFPTPWISFCKLFGLSRLFPNSKRFAQYALPYLDNNKQHKVEILSGAFMFCSHEALKKTGGFDESFFMYGEDIDLSHRITEAGYQNYYLPELLLHYKGESTKHDDIKYIKAFYEAMLIFYKKHYYRTGPVMSFLIKTAVWLKGVQAYLFGRQTKKEAKGNPNEKLLILANEEHLEEVKGRLSHKLSEYEVVNVWNLNERRPMDAISRKNQMIGYTEIAFCYPDLNFERMLLFMDKMPNKNITYYIYNRNSQKLIAHGK